MTDFDFQINLDGNAFTAYRKGTMLVVKGRDDILWFRIRLSNTNWRSALDRKLREHGIDFDDKRLGNFYSEVAELHREVRSERFPEGQAYWADDTDDDYDYDTPPVLRDVIKVVESKSPDYVLVKACYDLLGVVLARMN